MLSADHVSVRTPDDLLATVPHLLGFSPSGLVLVFVRDLGAGATTFSGSVSGVLRVDVPQHEGEVVDWLGTVLPCALRAVDSGGGVFVIGYADGDPFGNGYITPSDRECVRAVVGLVAAAVEGVAQVMTSMTVPLGAALLVGGGTWRALGVSGAVADWSGTGTAPDATHPVALSLTVAGSAPAVSRDELVARFAEGARSREVGRECEHRTVDVREFAAAWSVLLTGLTAAATGAGAQPAPVSKLPAGVLAAAAVGLREVPMRDALIVTLCPGLLPAEATRGMDAQVLRLVRAEVGQRLPWRTLEGLDASLAQTAMARLAEVCQCLPDSHAAPALAVAGYFGWWSGLGVQARIAADRAIQADPEYPLSQLLKALVDSGTRPPRGEPIG